MHKKTIMAASMAAATIASSLIATGAMAQEGMGGGGAPARAPVPVCPASGYNPPLFAFAGGNDGLTAVYQVVSPCSPPELKNVIESMGFGRSRPLSSRSVLATVFSATGTWVDAVAGPIKLDYANISSNYYYPGIRVEAKGKDAKGKPFYNTEVFNTDRAWDETGPGYGPKPGPKDAMSYRPVWMKLTPPGALLSIVEAEGHVTVGKDAQGNMTFTGKSPYEPYPVTITVNSANLVTKVSVPYMKHTYAASFDGYNPVTERIDNVRNKWEPGYLFPWVDHMTWTKDGKMIADLTTTSYQTNGYVVMPYPELLKATKEEADPMLGYDRNDPADPRNDPANQFTPGG